VNIVDGFKKILQLPFVQDVVRSHAAAQIQTERVDRGDGTTHVLSAQPARKKYRF
jgi:hypothetical protein